MDATQERLAMLYAHLKDLKIALGKLPHDVEGLCTLCKRKRMLKTEIAVVEELIEEVLGDD